MSSNIQHKLSSVGHASVYAAIFAFPILFISTPRITTALATVLAVVCLFYFLVNFKKHKSIFKLFDIRVVSISFFAYLLAVVITQIYFLKINSSEYQQQGRFILLFTLFLYIYIKKIELRLIATIGIPITCIVGAISSLYLFQAPAVQWGSRHTVQHIDPLNFGYLMLFLGFASLWIGMRWIKHFALRLMCLLAFCLGIYMSIRSGSRTGWLAIPLVVLWMLATSGKLNIRTSLLATLALTLGVALLYFTSETAYSRIHETIKDFKIYTWVGNPVANDTSVGVRLSMIRMGWFCFTESPLFGFGIRDMYAVLNTAYIQTYATDTVIKFSSSGFMHNEFITQVVQHGIIGGFAYLFILFSIFHVYKRLKKIKIKSSFPDVFIIYIIFAVIASLSTEILVVKPMILFFSFMLACYAGESLWKIHEAECAATT